MLLVSSLTYLTSGHLRPVHEEPEPDDADVHQPEPADRADHLLHHGIAPVRRRLERWPLRVPDKPGTVTSSWLHSTITYNTRPGDLFWFCKHLVLLSLFFPSSPAMIPFLWTFASWVEAHLCERPSQGQPKIWTPQAPKLVGQQFSTCATTTTAVRHFPRWNSLSEQSISQRFIFEWCVVRKRTKILVPLLVTFRH